MLLIGFSVFNVEILNINITNEIKANNYQMVFSTKFFYIIISPMHYVKLLLTNFGVPKDYVDLIAMITTLLFLILFLYLTSHPVEPETFLQTTYQILSELFPLHPV